MLKPFHSILENFCVRVRYVENKNIFSPACCSFSLRFCDLYSSLRLALLAFVHAAIVVTGQTSSVHCEVLYLVV